LPPTGFYGFCPTAAGRPDRSRPRPCITEKYVQHVHRALLDVTDCFGYDSRLAFSTFNLESALHLTAVGRATDVGVGQLTSVAIDEVNLNAIDRAIRQTRASAKPSCQRLLPFLTRHESGIQERCGFMNVPENPFRNIAYSVLLLQQIRRSVDNFWGRRGIQLPADIDTERLKVLITMLAYNAGPAGLVSTLDAYVRQMGSMIAPRHFNFQSPDPDSFIAYLATHFPSSDQAVRARVSKYMGHVIAASRRADTMAAVGGACIHPTYFPPTPPSPPPAPVPAPSALKARALVVRSALALAKGMSCHDFKFQFLAKDMNETSLPTELKRLYNRSCGVQL
ncbi:MAG TPA: hypothetical protein PKC28_01490, partial [Bdellovibrionales bacterium]|nr:hypothetical protein [Bdellovibrionales bacterium]